MRILIAEDDKTSGDFMLKTLARYGTCDLAMDGFEAMDAFLLAMKEGAPYHLLCIDVMMPKFDGIKVIRAIRDMEIQRSIAPGKRVRIIVTTALDKTQVSLESIERGYAVYLPKPVNLEKLDEQLLEMGFEVAPTGVG